MEQIISQKLIIQKAIRKQLQNHRLIVKKLFNRGFRLAISKGFQSLSMETLLCSWRTPSTFNPACKTFSKNLFSSIGKFEYIILLQISKKLKLANRMSNFQNNSSSNNSISDLQLSVLTQQILSFPITILYPKVFTVNEEFSSNQPVENFVAQGGMLGFGNPAQNNNAEAVQAGVANENLGVAANNHQQAHHDQN